MARKVAAPDRLQILMESRQLMQTRLLHEADAEWTNVALDLLDETNNLLRASGFAETDLPHLLPSASSDRTLISYLEFLHRSSGK